MKRDLYSQELSELLDKFVREMYRLNRADNPKFICQLVTKWTKGQLLLTKKLLQYLLELNKKISLGQEAAVVEKIVRTRLIKEFKQDELTLPIRQLLYAKDLVRLLTRTGGKPSHSDRTYLGKLQRKLGLSVGQCQSIEKQYLRAQLSVKLKVNKSSSIVRIEPEPDELHDSFHDLIELLENAPIYQELIAENRSPQQVLKSTEVRKFNKRQFWWICPIVPFLFLVFRQIDWQKSSRSVTANNVKLTSHCIDNPISPQMSLGSKLLSPSDSSQSDSQINLYQATTALTNCEYEVARTEFQRALNLDARNPEASIYLNNTKAIAGNKLDNQASNSLKIAVTVPLSSQPEVAWEVLQGVAKAQTEINDRGGINSQPLIVQVVDLPLKLDTATDIVRELTADESILAVVGHDDDNAHIKISQIYQKEELVMISPTSTDANLDRIGDRVLRIAPDLSSLVDTLRSYAIISSLNKIAVCADSNDADSSLFAREFTSKIESSNNAVAILNCDLAGENFNPVPLVERAISQNADAILLAPSVNTIDRAIAIAQVNQQRLALLGNHILYTDRTLRSGQAAVVNMVLATPGLANPNSQFETAKASWRTAMSYDATQAIIAGLIQSSNRSILQTVLNDPNFVVDGVTGKIQFASKKRTQVKLSYVERSAQNSQQFQFLPLEIEK